MADNDTACSTYSRREFIAASGRGIAGAAVASLLAAKMTGCGSKAAAADSDMWEAVRLNDFTLNDGYHLREQFHPRNHAQGRPGEDGAGQPHLRRRLLPRPLCRRDRPGSASDPRFLCHAGQRPCRSGNERPVRRHRLVGDGRHVADRERTHLLRRRRHHHHRSRARGRHHHVETPGGPLRRPGGPGAAARPDGRPRHRGGRTSWNAFGRPAGMRRDG